MTPMPLPPEEFRNMKFMHCISSMEILRLPGPAERYAVFHAGERKAETNTMMAAEAAARLLAL